MDLGNFKRMEEQGGIYYVNENRQVWNNRTGKFLKKSLRKATKKEQYNLHNFGKTKVMSIDAIMDKYFPKEVESLSKEIWKDIPKYEGSYQVSNFGRVKSLSRHIEQDGYTRFMTSKLLSDKKNNGRGYLVVSLCESGENKNHYVHILVANAFIPKIENKKEVNHIDFNKSNNTVRNLEWVNRKENIQHYRTNKESHYLEDKELLKNIKYLSDRDCDAYDISEELDLDYAKAKYILKVILERELKLIDENKKLKR